MHAYSSADRRERIFFTVQVQSFCVFAFPYQGDITLGWYIGRAGASAGSFPSPVYIIR
jgi:hypothetical protein